MIGRLVAIALTPGNTADISMAVPLLSPSAPSARLIADKAYDADSLRTWLQARRIKAVIPSSASRTVPHPLDRRAYRRRNVIERLFGRLKNLAAHRDAIRSPGTQLYGSHRARRRRGRVDLNESPT